MGILDKLLKALGFEEEGEIKEKSEMRGKKKEEKLVSVTSKFDLKKIEDVEDFSRNADEAEYYIPRSQNDIENIAYNLNQGISARVNFMDFIESDRIRALDFLSGAIFVLNGKVEKIDKTTYLFRLN